MRWSGESEGEGKDGRTERLNPASAPGRMEVALSAFMGPKQAQRPGRHRWVEPGRNRRDLKDVRAAQGNG